MSTTIRPDPILSVSGSPRVGSPVYLVRAPGRKPKLTATRPERMDYRILDRIPEPYYPGSPEDAELERANRPAPPPAWAAAATVPAPDAVRHWQDGDDEREEV